MQIIHVISTYSRSHGGLTEALLLFSIQINMPQFNILFNKKPKHIIGFTSMMFFFCVLNFIRKTQIIK